MAQVAILRSNTDLEALAPVLRAAHSRFLREHLASLVTFGPLFHDDGAPAGYAYQTDFPGTTIEPILRFLRDDPLNRARLFHAAAVHGWGCALKQRQATMPVRPGLQGFFFHGIGKPDITARRNETLDAHRAHLMPVDDTHCISRGPLTDAEGKDWLGSAMVYEFADRRAFDDFFKHEPYCINGLYERIDIYRWRRGTAACPNTPSQNRASL
jgi:uncharacterized protein YciI